eukprot:scaffold6534_cov87-Skeletonema_dohrnii-CCMP3373.AAC.3
MAGGDPLASVEVGTCPAVTLLSSFSSSFRPLPDTIQAISNIRKPSKNKKKCSVRRLAQDTRHSGEIPDSNKTNTGQQIRLPTQRELCYNSGSRFSVL